VLQDRGADAFGCGGDHVVRCEIAGQSIDLGEAEFAEDRTP